MVFSKLKYNFVARRLKNVIVERPNGNSQNKIINLLVIADIDRFNDLEKFKELSNSLGIHQDYYNVLAFSRDKKTIKTFNDSLLTQKKLSWKGVVKDKAINNLLKTDVDLLVNYFNTDNVSIGFASASVRAKFRVGFPNTNEGLNDLIIDCELSDFNMFKTEMIKYLKVLNKI